MGRNGTSTNSRMGRDIHVLSCNQGYARACSFAAQEYMSADYNLKGSYSPDTARAFFIKACDLGDADGCHSAAGTYPRNSAYDSERLALYERACRMGSRGGCNGADMINEVGDYAPR